MANSSFGSGFKTGFGSAFLQFALERFASFGSLAWKEISVIWGVEDELRKLQRTFLKIQDLVDFVEGSPFRFSAAWQMWFEDMRKLAYDADALLDHISLHLSSFCAQNSVMEKQVRSMVISSFHNVQIPHMITEMQKKLDELAKEMESLVAIEKVKFDAKTTLAARSSQSCSDFHFEGSSFVDDTTMMGRDDVFESIIEFLVTKGENNNFSVMSIVGMGGIGKTALTQLVYNSEERLISFELRIWVSVSMDFDVVRITKSIIKYAIIGGCDISNLNALQLILEGSNLCNLNSLQLMLKGILCEKKFLLVLDDYWSEKRDDWSTLSWPFRFGGRGSKVIVTTRSSKASFIVSPEAENVHKLDILSDGDCWELIRRRASVASQNLLQIGMQIARKCKGLPLAATILGSMLHGKYTEEEWHYVLENELGDMPQAKNIFLNLMRSYLYLPAHLQKCFAYCAIFPQDYEFEMEELVHLWMAEGFIQLVGGSRRLEDLGRDYFNDLYSRSLFEQCMSTSGQIRYKMHDLILDMARLVSQGICFHGKNDSEGSYPLFGNTCHLGLFHDNTQPLELKAYVKNERLRTFLVMSNAVTSEIHPQLFAHLQFLRVLGLAHCGLTELTSSVDQLKYLRYLNLSENPISNLPESICKLVALEILKLRDCLKLRDLPKDIKNLFNLRHLDMDIKGQLQVMPKQLGKLSNLQSLSAYIIGIKKGNGIEELKNMKWLRGSLCIKNIHFVSKEEDAKEAHLHQKTCLDKLELQWKELDGLNSQLLDQRRSEQAKVLQSLCPHENLKELLIVNYCGIVYPNWLTLSSRNFTSIHLQGLKYCVNLPSLGELPLLKSFFISDMPCLEYVNDYLYGSSNGAKFPSLESFHIHDMLELKEWIIYASRDENMPCIKTFTIHDCPKLTSLPPELRDLPNPNIANCPLLP